MNDLLFRTRVAVLWLAVAIATTGSLLLYLFLPGAVEELLAGEMEGETLTDATGYFLAAMGIIPGAFAVVTLLVNGRSSRYVNLIAGLAFGLFAVFGVVTHAVDDGFNAHVLLFAVAGALAFLIAGMSWRSLRQPTLPATVEGSDQSRSREEATV